MTNTRIDYSTVALILRDALPAHETIAGQDHYYRTSYRNNNDGFFGAGDRVTKTELYNVGSAPENFEVTHDVEDLQAGIEFLNKLTNGKVFLVHDDATNSDFVISDDDKNIGIPMVHVYQVGKNGEDIADVDFAYGQAQNQYPQQTYHGSVNLPLDADKCYPKMDKKVTHNPECTYRTELLARAAQNNYERVIEIRDQINEGREKLHSVLKVKPDAVDFSSIAKFIELQDDYATAMKAFNESMKTYYDRV